MKEYGRLSVVGGTIKGYGVVFSDMNTPDLDKQFFDRDTDFMFNTVPTSGTLLNHSLTKLPTYFRDGKKSSDNPSDYYIGPVTDRWMDETGIWFETLIETNEEWVEAVVAAIEKGDLGYSSDSIAHLTRYVPQYNGTEYIKAWPIPLISISHFRAEPRASVRYFPMKSLLNPEHYATLKSSLKLGLDRLIDRTQSLVDQKTDISKQGKIVSAKATPSQIARKKAMTAAAKSLLEANLEAVKEVDLEVLQDTLEAAADAGTTVEVDNPLMPIATELAAMFNVSPERALALLIRLTAEMQTADEEPPASDGEYMTTVTKNADEEKDPDATKAKGTKSAKSVSGSVWDRAFSGGFTGQKRQVPAVIETRGEKEFMLTKAAHAQVRGDHRALKAMGLEPDSKGGFMVPPEYSSEWVGLLRANTVVLPLCRQVPMTRDLMYITKQTGSASASWTGENKTITPGDDAYGQLELKARKLTVMKEASNELLADGGPDVERWLMEDITAGFAEKIDYTILLGSGVGYEPLGLLNNPAILKTPLNAAMEYADLVEMQERLEEDNVSMIGNVGWVIAPQGKSIIRQLEDSSGRLIFTGGMSAGWDAAGPLPNTLLDYPYKMTTLGGKDASNRSRIFFGNWSEVIVGMRKTIEIVSSNVAGDAFNKDQTLIRAIMRMDIVIRYTEAMQIMTAVQGAA